MNKNHVDGFVEKVGDILSTDIVDSMKTYNHHGKISTHYHSTFVAFRVYEDCLRLKIRDDLTSEITRAAMLHDFYLYDWHTEKHEQNHIWYHPVEAEKNVEKYLFMPTKMQKDMILRHMFPAAGFPNSKGGWLLTLNDKYCASIELLGLSAPFMPIYLAIDKKVKENAENNL